MSHFNVSVRQKPHSPFPIPRFSNIQDKIVAGTFGALRIMGERTSLSEIV